MNHKNLYKMVRRLKRDIHLSYHEEKTIDVVTFNEKMNRLNTFQNNVKRYKNYQNKKNTIIQNNKTHDYILSKALNFYNTDKTFLSFDVEAFEFKQSKILEIGFTIFSRSSTSYHHFIIKENMKFQNGKYVKNNRDNFNFGESEILPYKNAYNKLNEAIRKSDVLVGHSLNEDLTFLNIKPKMFTICTARLSKKYNTNQWMNLGKLATLFGLEPKYLHNAGNDSVYTSLCLLKMMNDYQQIK